MDRPVGCDDLVPAAPAPTIPGTVDTSPGVSAVDHARLGAAGRIIVVLLLAACLGFQGERCEVDPALRSPGTALATYWEALMNHDVEGIWACAAGPPGDLPYPGMQWGLPATRAFTIENLRFIPIDEDHVSATYKVRFRPRASRKPSRSPDSWPGTTSAPALQCSQSPRSAAATSKKPCWRAGWNAIRRLLSSTSPRGGSTSQLKYTSMRSSTGSRRRPRFSCPRRQPYGSSAGDLLEQRNHDIDDDEDDDVPLHAQAALVV